MNLINIRDIENRIFLIRGQRVIIDMDIAALYGVTTKALNQAVKRNQKRFPVDFTFRLTEVEKHRVVTICDHLRKLRFSPVFPYAFTEHGAVMLASLLNSPMAVHASVQVVRAFVRMRHALALDKDLARQVEKLAKKVDQHDTDIRVILRDIQSLLNAPEPDAPTKDVLKIRGFSKD